MSVPPDSPVPAQPSNTAPQSHDPALGGSGPDSASGFWDSDTNRLFALVGGILVGCVLLAGMTVTAVAGAQALNHSQDSRHGFSRGEPNGGAERGPGHMGKRGFGNPDRDAEGSGPEALGGLGGLGGLLGELSTFANIQHGDVVVTGSNGQAETKRIARGAISEVTATTVTVKSADGFSTAYTLAATTKITIDGTTGAVTGLKVGQSAFALGTVSGAAATADRVMATTS